jgi:Ribbon-helix-helix protein, copG family
MRQNRLSRTRPAASSIEVVHCRTLMVAQGLSTVWRPLNSDAGGRLTYVSHLIKLTHMEKTQVYLRKEELDALRKVAARSRRSVAALVREAVRKAVLMPAAEGPIAIWDGEPKRSSLDHDSVHDEP